MSVKPPLLLGLVNCVKQFSDECRLVSRLSFVSSLYLAFPNHVHWLI
jgi:hypothetical protein